jgi:hypothetical protein
VQLFAFEHLFFNSAFGPNCYVKCSEIKKFDLGKIMVQDSYKWLTETAHKRSHHGDVLKLTWLQQFLRARVLAEISRDEITATGERKKAAASGPTAYRLLALSGQP